MQLAYNKAIQSPYAEGSAHSICRLSMFRQTRHSTWNTAIWLRAVSAVFCSALALLTLPLPAVNAAAVAQPQGASEVTRSSIITTLAGNGIASGADFDEVGGDGGSATQATLNLPASVAVDTAGNVYIADSANHRIRLISPDGHITTVAGAGEAGDDGDGGQARDARLRRPLGVAASADGTLFVADTYNHRIRMVTAAGVITTVAGTGMSGFSGDGGPGAAAMLAYPTGIAVADGGALYIADTGNHRVRKLEADGTITTVAGTGAAGFNGDGGPATLARLNSPRGVAVAADGTLFIVDRENRRIRMVDAHGTITTVAGAGGSGFSGDRGQATLATLRAPYGIAVDSRGNLYIADTLNHRVRKVTPGGSITTVAGSNRFGFGGDGWPAGQAALHYPLGIAVDIAGNLYIADTFNHRVRKVWASADTEPTPSLFSQLVPVLDVLSMQLPMARRAAAWRPYSHLIAG